MRKPRVLLIAPNPEDGTSLMRAWGPYSRIEAIDLVKPDGGEMTWATLSNVDVCVFQRPGTQHDVMCIELAKRWCKPVIVDYDDNGFDVASDNPAAEFYSQDDKRAAMRECLRLADIVTVSTLALKEALLEQVSTADIRVIPNAVDDCLFETAPSYHERNKTILLRGASGHRNDWAKYKDGILQILKDFPDWTLSVFGFHPDWLREIPDSQLRLYQFQDIATYFEHLMEIRPAIMIVPLLDTNFNRCKSNIALLEGVIAGAAVMASDLPEFRDAGACVFNSNEELVVLAKDLITDREILRHYYDSQIHGIPKLSEINEKRLDIIEELTRFTKKKRPLIKPKSVATDQEFHDYALSHGHTQDWPDYQKHHAKSVEWLIKTVNPKTVFEFGVGTGGTLVEFLKRGVVAQGFELNPINIQYFKDRYPMYEHMVHQADLTKETVEGDDICDLGISIEVLEHITLPEEEWDRLLSSWSKKFKYFYFTSTPYYTTEWMDHWWGHINIRKSSTWIQMFERNGWKFLQNPRALVNWDLLFASKALGDLRQY